MKWRKAWRWFTESKTVPWEYHTFRRRFFAGIIDGFVMMPIGAVLMFILRMDTLPVFVLLPAFTLHRTMYYIYSIPLHGLYGQTIGKRVMNVKVLAQDETPLGMRRAFMRDAAALLITIAGLVLVIPACMESGKWVFEASSTTGTGHSILIWTSSLWFFTEVFTMLVSERRRALHDVIADSVVVRTEKLEAEDDVPVRTSGMPIVTMRPVTLSLIIITGVFLFIGIAFFGHKNSFCLLTFESMYSDRRIARNLEIHDFVEPAPTSLSILARRKSPLGVPKARELLKTEKHQLSGAFYLAALGYGESVPYLIRHAGPYHNRKKSGYYIPRIKRYLDEVTGRNFGTNPVEWMAWWNTNHPSEKIAFIEITEEPEPVIRSAKTDLSVFSRKQNTYVSIRALTAQRDQAMILARALSPCNDGTQYENIIDACDSLICDIKTPLNSVFSLYVSGCDDAKAVALADTWAQRIMDQQDANEPYRLRIIRSAQMTKTEVEK